MQGTEYFVSLWTSVVQIVEYSETYLIRTYIIQIRE